MKPAIHKGRESRLLPVLAAVLFLGASAYLGVFLHGALTALRPARPAFTAAQEPPLSGIAVRQERVIDPIPGAEDGKRLTGRGIYASFCDGYEYLSPDDRETIDPASPGAPRETPGKARLVESAAWYYIARFTGEDCPRPGRCRLRFSGFDGSVPARLLTVRETGEGRLLVFRLLEGGEYLNIRMIQAEIERG